MDHNNGCEGVNGRFVFIQGAIKVEILVTTEAQRLLCEGRVIFQRSLQISGDSRRGACCREVITKGRFPLGQRIIDLT
jgi:hypothetical protein